MAVIIKTSINLTEIPKDKIIVGKKGIYLPISITVNNEPDQFGNQGPVCVDQTKEEREAKVGKVYLGNCKVVWTDGVFPEPNRDNQPAPPTNKPQAVAADPDLPF